MMYAILSYIMVSLTFDHLYSLFLLLIHVSMTRRFWSYIWHCCHEYVSFLDTI